MKEGNLYLIVLNQMVKVAVNIAVSVDDEKLFYMLCRMLEGADPPGKKEDKIFVLCRLESLTNAIPNKGDTQQAHGYVVELRKRFYKKYKLTKKDLPSFDNHGICPKHT